MKILNDISLTGNPDIDKHSVAKTGLFENVEYQYLDMVVSDHFYSYLNQELEKDAFKNFLETNYPEGFVAALDSYVQEDGSKTFVDFYFYQLCDYDQMETAYNFISTCIQNEIWVEEIADYLIDNPELLEQSYNKSLMDDLIYTVYMSKDMERSNKLGLLNKSSRYPDTDIQEEADIKIRRLLFASNFSR